MGAIAHRPLVRAVPGRAGLRGRPPRPAWVLLVAVLAAALVGAPAAPAGQSDGSERAHTVIGAVEASPKRLAKLERRVLRQLNAYRRRHDLRPLRASGPLARAARVHGFAMARKGFFSHDSANGSSFDSRIQRFYRVAGFRRWAVGENLLWSSGALNGKRAITLWNDSPGHRRNMLNPRWREVGVAAVRMRRAPGVYRGLTATIVVTDFGSRAP